MNQHHILIVTVPDDLTSGFSFELVGPFDSAEQAEQRASDLNGSQSDGYRIDARVIQAVAPSAIAA